MPCRMDIPDFAVPASLPKRRPNLKKFITLGDKATYSADVIREYLLTGIALEPLCRNPNTDLASTEVGRQAPLGRHLTELDTLHQSAAPNVFGCG